jgi:iron complex transport system ATP-binding protein
MILEAERVTCGYREVDVLSDVSLRIGPGEFVALAGPNGSGKSTLIRALSRVLRPRGGRVLLDGRDVYGLTARESARAIAVLPQDTSMAFDFTVEEVVSMGRAPRLGRFEEEGPADREAVERALERAGIVGLRGRAVTELSGGERQRAALARAFAQEPQVLLLDEPTAHLDLACQAQVLRAVRALRRESGVGVLAAIHDLNLAAAHADRLVLLSMGRVAVEGAPGEVLTEARLGEVFGEEFRVRTDPETGRPWVCVRS